MAIIENDRRPRVPPTISIRECQKAISIAGGIRISLRGEERLITEVRTGGGGNTRWFSGGLRFTLTEQERLSSAEELRILWPGGPESSVPAPTTAPDSRPFFIRSAGVRYSSASITTSSDHATRMSQRFDLACPRLPWRQPRCAQKQRVCHIEVGRAKRKVRPK